MTFAQLASCPSGPSVILLTHLVSRVTTQEGRLRYADAPPSRSLNGRILVPWIAFEERLCLGPPVGPWVVSVIVFILGTGKGRIDIRLLPALFFLLLLLLVWLLHGYFAPR